MPHCTSHSEWSIKTGEFLPLFGMSQTPLTLLTERDQYAGYQSTRDIILVFQFLVTKGCYYNILVGALLKSFRLHEFSLLIRCCINILLSTAQGILAASASHCMTDSYHHVAQ